MAEEFRLTSSAFGSEGRIPRKHTADGSVGQHDLSPPLQWHNVPEGTESLAIIVEDVTAPEVSESTTPFIYWVVVNIPPTLKGLPAGFNHKDVEGHEEYGDIQEGVNDDKSPNYRGPKPGTDNQRIEFKIFALDTKVKLGKKATKDKLVDAMQDHILAEATLVGTYHTRERSEGGGFLYGRDPMDGQPLYHNFQ